MVVDLSVQVIGIDKIQNLGRLPVAAFPGILKAAASNASKVAKDGVGGTAALLAVFWRPPAPEPASN